MRTSDTWGESECPCSCLLACPGVTDLPLCLQGALHDCPVFTALSPLSSQSPTEMPLPHLEAPSPGHVTEYRLRRREGGI